MRDTSPPTLTTTAGIRMEIPPHLLMTHRLLNMFGFNLKQKHGRDTRRIIKFDMIEQSLYLAYKIPGSEIWHDVTLTMAKSFKERENQRSLLHFSNNLSPPGRWTTATSYATGANAIEKNGLLPVNGSRSGREDIQDNIHRQTWLPESLRTR